MIFIIYIFSSSLELVYSFLMDDILFSPLLIGKSIKQPVEENKVKNKSAKGKTVNAVTRSTPFSNPELFVNEILDKTSALIFSEVSTICLYDYITFL